MHDSIIFPFIIFAILLFMYALSRCKLPIEKGKIPVLKITCSGRYGAIAVSIPFVRFNIYEDFVVFAYGFRRFSLKFKEIDSISYQNNIFQKCLIFFLKKKSLPQKVIIRSRKNKEIIELLNRKGINIIN
ncbi:MAG: hypothetical protein GY714_31935 [Desulfobacterales bacterium]|nr:hypothetical protein [Desulfobacterales bacterium]